MPGPSQSHHTNTTISGKQESRYLGCQIWMLLHFLGFITLFCRLRILSYCGSRSLFSGLDLYPYHDKLLSILGDLLDRVGLFFWLCIVFIDMVMGGGKGCVCRWSRKLPRRQCRICFHKRGSQTFIDFSFPLTMFYHLAVYQFILRWLPAWGDLHLHTCWLAGRHLHIIFLPLTFIIVIFWVLAHGVLLWVWEHSLLNLSSWVRDHKAGLQEVCFRFIFM